MHSKFFVSFMQMLFTVAYVLLLVHALLCFLSLGKASADFLPWLPVWAGSRTHGHPTAASRLIYRTTPRPFEVGYTVESWESGSGPNRANINRVADPHHFNADLDPALYIDADPHPTPDLADTNLPPMVYRPSILSLQASTGSVHGPPRLHFKPLKLLNFALNADPDPASKITADPDPKNPENKGGFLRSGLIRIQITA